jgi:exopolysaccharide production protein ExoQ
MTWRRLGSWELVIPGAWLAIQGSRPVSYWFGSGSTSSDVDGNPINTFIYAVFILAAVVVLRKNGVNWAVFIRQNKALCLIYFYLALTALWSDMPFVSLKRVVKDFGCVLVAMIFITQADPAAVVRTIFVRVSYLLFPLSVICIKYFPEIGRNSSRSGMAMFTGLTTQKNSLGQVVFVFSLMLLWDLYEIYKEEERKGKKTQLLIRIGMLFIGFWLLKTCDSETSRLCLILGFVIFLGSLRLMRLRQGKQILIICLAAIICLFALDKTFGLSDIIIRAMGRNPTLTGRTDIWRLVLAQNTDPIIGNGFYTFWDSDKAKAVLDSFLINEAHNGYLEMYVDGGMIGVVLLGLLLLTAGKRVVNGLFAGATFGKIGLIFWFLPIIYNWSETSFFRLDLLWFTFLLVTIEYQRRMPPAMVEEGV